MINMVNLCIRCHREIHADEGAAYDLGWIILDRFPGAVPFLSNTGWLLPDGDGGLALLDFARGRAVLHRAPVRDSLQPRRQVRPRPGHRHAKRYARRA